MRGSGKKGEIQPVFVSIATNKGKVRAVNEDNFYADILGVRPEEELCGHRVLGHPGMYVFAVFDGMSGEQFGDKASEIAACTMKDFSGKFSNSSPEELHDIVNEYVRAANRRICRMAEENLADISGSTFVMACVRGNMVYPFSIGDSRIYYRSGRKLRQISEDQTVAMRKVKANIYTQKEARLSEDSHKITTFLGVDKADIGLNALAYEPLDLRNGEVLLCSDGLTDMCSDKEILRIMDKFNDDFTAQHLVDLAMDNGGADNITCIVIRSI